MHGGFGFAFRRERMHGSEHTEGITKFGCVNREQAACPLMATDERGDSPIFSGRRGIFLPLDVCL
jgi:hypothetical protein